MKYLLTCFSALLLSISSVYADVRYEVLNNPNGTFTSVTDPITVAYSTQYTQPSTQFVSISVTPQLDANLATGIFNDAMRFTANGVCPGCDNLQTLALLPYVSISDGFILSNNSGVAIPWSIALIAKAHIDSDAISDIRLKLFGGSSPSAVCFSNSGSRCADNGFSTTTPSDVPITLTQSGVALSGASISFLAEASGDSLLIFNHTARSYFGDLNLDPRVQLLVPQGTVVQSISGVFPVPEPSTYTLMLGGLAILGVAIGSESRKLKSRGHFWARKGA